MSTDPESSADAYSAAIEETFVRLRGAPYLPTPRPLSPAPQPLERLGQSRTLPSIEYPPAPGAPVVASLSRRHGC